MAPRRRILKDPMSYPVALTIAGSDSGGGAGIQADLKTFSAFQVFGTSVLTCVTAQNPREVTSVQALDPEMIRKQLEAIFSYFEVKAFKTGMLFSTDIIETIGVFLQNHNYPALIVDPVMVSTSGATLLKPEAIEALKTHILPKAALLTPNIQESEILGKVTITRCEEMQKAAHTLFQRYQVPVLVKGGHLPQNGEAIDYFFDGRIEQQFSHCFMPEKNAHGTGCTLSAAIAAGVAQGKTILESIRIAKIYLSEALEQSFPVGSDLALSHFVS